MMLELLTQITSLAAVDAVNPCTLTVMALLLLTLVITKGRRDALLGGILFTLTIYFMYLLYGLGILQLLYMTGAENVLNIILRILLVIMIIMEFYAFFKYKPGIRSLEMPMKLRPYAQKLLKSVENPLMAVPIAALCSVLLLPCSSGPYLSALLILAGSTVKKIAVLLYYNLIFVSPMIAITLIAFFGMSPQRVLEWKEKHIRKLHLISGILLLIVLILVSFPVV